MVFNAVESVAVGRKEYINRDPETRQEAYQ